MLLIPITPPPFYWPSSTQAEDVKVHEWIHQAKSIKEVQRQSWDIVLFGVPLSRSSISVSGASEFPEVFRRSWKGFSTYNIDFEMDLKELRVVDIGDVQMNVTDIPKCHANIKEAVTGIRAAFPTAIPVAIGGDHSITAMIVSGLKDVDPKKEIGILQFDTHLDLRDIESDGPTNGTPIRNLIESGKIKGENVYNIGIHGFFNSLSLVKYAKEKGVHYFTLRQARRQGLIETVKKALQQLEQKVDQIYVTIDMDVLDIGVAPGVPASTPGGMTTEELFEAVYTAALSSKVCGMDIVCLDPTKDGSAQPTVKAGTYTFLSFLTGFMKNKDSIE